MSVLCSFIVHTPRPCNRYLGIVEPPPFSSDRADGTGPRIERRLKYMGEATYSRRRDV